MSDPQLIRPAENGFPHEVVASPAPPPPSRLRNIFTGPQGIRPGWRFLLYLAMAVALFLVFGFILQPLQPHGGARLWMEVIIEGLMVVVAIVPGLVMARIEKRPFSAYGLPARHAFGKLFWIGSLWGLLAITLLLVTIRGFHGFYFGHLALHGVRIVKFALFWGLYFLLVGFFEEFLLRGYAQFTLSEGMGFWPAAAILSATFGALHYENSGEAWIGLLSAALIGFFFCLTLRRTGNLWFAVGFHQAFDWGETFLYSVPNSGTVEPGHLLKSSFHGPVWLTGGSVGPEGSVFVFIMVAVMWVIFDRVYPVAKYPAKMKMDQFGEVQAGGAPDGAGPVAPTSPSADALG